MRSNGFLTANYINPAIHYVLMGRIKTKLVKRITNDVLKNFGDELTTTFDENKKVITEHVDSQSKKLRNTIAGYATRLKRKLAATQ
jgi:small subunit ribosomal protein S17e